VHHVTRRWTLLCQTFYFPSGRKALPQAEFHVAANFALVGSDTATTERSANQSRRHEHHAKKREMKVYRLRNLPRHADRQLAAELLAACTVGVALNQILISSLAHVVDPWTRPPTKSATLTIADFDADAHVRWSSARDEWTLPKLPGLLEPLILDHHFHGFTPLNDIHAENHEYE